MLVKAKKCLDFCVDWTAIILFLVMTSVSFHQVVARYVFSNPPSWSEEIARYAFVWLTFLGAAIAFRTKAHLGVDFFVGLLPSRLQKVIAFLVSLTLIAVLYITITKGMDAVQMVQRQLSPALRFSMSYAYLSIPVGGALMLIEVVWNLVQTLLNRELS